MIDLPDPPTDIFTGTNHLTFGALRLIHDRGLRIPDDVALVAFDEVAWMSVVSPPPTVAAQPTHDLGRLAAELLLERIEDGARPAREVVLQPTLIIRRSCAHHLGQDAVQPTPEPVSKLGA